MQTVLRRSALEERMCSLLLFLKETEQMGQKRSSILVLGLPAGQIYTAA